MNIIVVGRGYPNQGSSYGLFEYDQAHALSQRGNKVCYLFSDNRSIKELRDISKVSCQDGYLTVFGESLPIGGIPYRLFGEVKSRSLIRLLKLAEVKMGHIDVVYVHFPLISTSPQFVRYLRKRKLPLVCMEHWGKVLSNTLDEGRRRFLVQLAHDSTRFCCVSADLARSVATITGLPREAIHVIPNLVSEELFNYSEDANSRGRKRLPLLNFIWCGRIERVKALDTLVEAMSKTPKNIRLVMVGEGSDKTRIVSLVNSLDLADRVVFLGWRTRKELPTLYEDADCFISVSKAETFCVPIVEAWYSGLPCIAPNDNPLRNYFTKENGILFNRNDVDSIAASIISIHRNFSTYNRSAISDWAHKTFSSSETINQVENVLREAQNTK